MKINLNEINGYRGFLLGVLKTGESSFVRVHQSHLINLDYVARYIKGEGGTVIMEDGSEVEISRRKKELFLKRIM